MSWIEQIVREPVTVWAAVAIAAYVLGCFSTGYYLVRFKTGVDIRTSGSGSTGARNVGRLLGKTGFVLTVIGDVSKGVAAVAIAKVVLPRPELAMLALVAVVLGHLWPVQLGFHGGKGVATSLGGLVVFSVVSALAYFGLFAAVYLISRKTVLSGLVAYVVLPLAVVAMKGIGAEFGGVCVLSLLVIVAHRENAIDLLRDRVSKQNPARQAKLPEETQ